MTSSTGTNTSPHVSNIVNKLDPRADLDMDHWQCGYRGSTTLDF
ncbi:hypothetical protein EYZ11_005456 [Aspergillus tanneri]|uniref:Uncharacterized protein n=1 Tax=Aspergillus tanneri TaxID=1220188 RepID=A0A4S3JNW0_9EURO|nr:hypothetical protein EYZ11_005456 [Aspergillus tanneri]